jgi:hypothetical protein
MYPEGDEVSLVDDGKREFSAHAAQVGAAQACSEADDFMVSVAKMMEDNDAR